MGRNFNTQLWVPNSQKLKFISLVKKKSPLETGGVLMGYYWPENKSVVLKEVIAPGLKAKHSSNSFIPDYDFHIEAVKNIFLDDDRLTYIGDWHSHPNGGCGLSFRDKKTLRNISKCRPSRLPNPVMLILYGNPQNWEIVAYQLFSEKRWWGKKHNYQPLEVKFFN